MMACLLGHCLGSSSSQVQLLPVSPQSVVIQLRPVGARRARDSRAVCAQRLRGRTCVACPVRLKRRALVALVRRNGLTMGAVGHEAAIPAYVVSSLEAFMSAAPGTQAETKNIDVPKFSDDKIVIEAAENEILKPKVAADAKVAAKKVVDNVAGGKVAGAKVARKVADKSLHALISEDVIPMLKDSLEKEDGVLNVDLSFENNQLQGSFTKAGVLYSFWAYFPDGKLQGSKGFSISSHGSPPSTVEPFLIDEKKITAQLIVFWITKRLFAQNLLSLN